MIRLDDNNTLYTIKDKSVRDSDHRKTISSVSVCNATIPTGKRDLECEKAVLINRFIEHNYFMADNANNSDYIYHLKISKDKGNLILTIIRSNENPNSRGNPILKTIKLDDKEIKERAKIYWNEFCIASHAERTIDDCRMKYHSLASCLLRGFLKHNHKLEIDDFGSKNLFGVYSILLNNDSRFSYDMEFYT